jgi:protein-disulfide isomerase
MDKKSSLFEYLGPGKSFVFGIVATLLVFFSIGFFWLLFSDGSIKVAKTNDKLLADFNKPTNTPPTANDPTGGTVGEINIAPVTTDDHIRGDIAQAQVVIVEFSDIDCPFCQRFHTTMQQIIDDYQGKVAWVYRHFPLDSLHPQARKKSEATECVAALGGNDAFWAYLDRLYEEGTDDLVGFAKAVGVNETSFNDCLNSGTYAEKVQNQYQDAINSGGQGTPYSVAITRDGQRIPISGALPITNIKSIIDPLLQN